MGKIALKKGVVGNPNFSLAFYNKPSVIFSGSSFATEDGNIGILCNMATCKWGAKRVGKGVINGENGNLFDPFFLQEIKVVCFVKRLQKTAATVRAAREGIALFLKTSGFPCRNRE